MNGKTTELTNSVSRNEYRSAMWGRRVMLLFTLVWAAGLR
jgi:hypothetical protein